MRKMLLLVAAAGLLSLAAAQGVAADNGKTQCTGTLDSFGVFTGTTKDLVVPAGNACAVVGATITHDLIVEKGASVGVDSSSIGHDLKGTGAALVELIGYTGPIMVGHDVTLTGTSPEAQSYGAYDVCDTT